MTPLLVGMIEFARPNRLWWLLLIPVIGAGYVGLCMRTALSRRPRSRLDLVIPRDKAWKRHVAVACSLLSLAALVIAFAQPQDYTEVPRDRATVVIAIDVSRSMIATDVAPNRLAASKSAADSFVNNLPARFNVALVSFAGVASLVVPPTTDHETVTRSIDALQVAPSTAIGEGIYQSLRALSLVPPDPANPKQAVPAAIVLLSDGATNIGRSSSGAAQQAKTMKVPIYTIAYGTPGGYVIDQGQRVPVPVDYNELAQIARTSGGKAYTAQSSSQLKNVYASIAHSVGTDRVYTEVTGHYAGIALLFAILAALGVISLGARWP